MKKKIAIILNSLGIGGNESSAYYIATALKESYQIDFILMDDSHRKYAWEDGAVVDLKTKPSKFVIGKIINTFLRIFKIRKQVKKNRYYAILIILPPSNIINYLRFKDTIKIVSCRDYSSLKSNLGKFKKIVKASNAIVFNSKKQKELFDNYFPNGKSVCLHNMIDYSFIVAQASKSNEISPLINLEKKKVVFVGRLVKEKGIGRLLRIFRYVDTLNIAQLIIIGDGPLASELNKFNFSDANDIIYLGYQNNPYKYLKMSDVFVLTSINEGFPNVILEAMSLNTAVISADCPSGPSEILNTKSQFGFLCHDFQYDVLSVDEPLTKDEQVFANKIIELIKDDSLLNEFKKNSFVESQKYFLDNAKNDYISFFNSFGE